MRVSSNIAALLAVAIVVGICCGGGVDAAATATAEGIGGEEGSDIVAELLPFAGVYNAEIADRVPPFWRGMFAEQRVNVKIRKQHSYLPVVWYTEEGDQKTFVYEESVSSRAHIITDSKGYIVASDYGYIAQPTMTAMISEADIRAVMNADDPLRAFAQVHQRGGLQLEGNGFYQKMQVWKINRMIQAYSYYLNYR